METPPSLIPFHEGSTDYINEHFEAAWESLRPVPLVTVDFGGGNVIRRTLRGNIATYVCDTEGHLLDILPGIYEPTTYLAQLEQLELLSRWAEQADGIAAAVVGNYHDRQLALLKAGQPPETIVARDLARFSIMRVESNIRYLLTNSYERPLPTAQGRAARHRREIPDLGSPTELAQWQPLFDDTSRNESQRRKQIHEHLGAQGLVAPAVVTKWLYREVLDADLDDPYLGLGKLLMPTTGGNEAERDPPIECAHRSGRELQGSTTLTIILFCVDNYIYSCYADREYDTS